VRVQGVTGRLSVTVYCEIMSCRLIDKNFCRFPSVIVIASSYSCVSDASGPINRPQCPRGLRRGSAVACLLAGVADRILLGAWMSVLVSSMCIQVEVSAMGLSSIQRSPTERVVSECDFEN
jgi:hypothetical protein